MITEGTKHPSHRRRRVHGRPGGLPLLVLGAVLMTLLDAPEAFAHARIYRQVDPATGIITFVYRPSAAQHGNKRPPRAAPQELPETKPARPATSTARNVETRRAKAPRAVPAAYRDFPSVSASTQRERDSERRRILKQELAWEQAKLDEAIEDKAGGDVLQRHKANIEALHREIGNME